MPRFLRFQLYDTPSRSTYSQLHSDIEVDYTPTFAYGESIRVGDDANDPETWPTYVVAHIVHLKQEPDPDRPGKNKIIYEAYLAREDMWEEFDLPEELKESGRSEELL